MPMKRPLRDKWVAALRSGEYRQGNGYLRRKTSGQLEYCCLGVLCDVSGTGTWAENRETFYFCVKEVSACRLYLTPELLQRFGLSDTQQDTLTRMNDDARKSFAVIADWIEANVPVEN